MNKKNISVALVIHAEEEFDWDSKLFDRNNTEINHANELKAFSLELIDLGAKLTVAVDYPFIDNSEAVAVLQELIDHYSQSIEIATQLHSWVTPPFFKEETQSDRTSYSCNLSFQQEREKLISITNKIRTTLGVSPQSYLAGRYGYGKNTAKILSELGYTTDLSISAFSDFTAQTGPNFSRYTNAPFVSKGILHIPHTCGFTTPFNWLSKILNTQPGAYSIAKDSHILSILMRVFRVKLLRLSPESLDLENLVDLTQELYLAGVDKFILSFHSSSLLAGKTPYIRSEEELDSFLTTIKSYLLFLNKNFEAKYTLARDISI